MKKTVIAHQVIIASEASSCLFFPFISPAKNQFPTCFTRLL